MRRKAAVFLLSISVAFGGIAATSSHAAAFNCTNGGVMCGYDGKNYAGTRLFNPSSISIGAHIEMTDDLLSSVNNDTTGARLCLMENDIIDWPYMGVPAGVGYPDLSVYGVNNQVDYGIVRANSDAC
jgi:hypothetical protein